MESPPTPAIDAVPLPLDDGISVVIPAYNSSQTLPALVPDLCRVLSGITPRFEVILVDDGSQDDTWRAIQELVEQHSAVRGMQLMRNYGQHNALLCGIRVCRFPITVTLDDDLQHPPSEIPKLLDGLALGYDVVYGVPIDEQHELWRALASRLTKLVLSSTMGVAAARKVSAFRAFRTQVRGGFPEGNSSFVSIDVLLSWGSTRFHAVPVEHRVRGANESNYTVGKLIRHALDMMTGFSTLPLQLASWIGFGCTLFGLLVLGWVVGRYLIEGGSIPGFPFLASTIAIFSGAQLFALGIIGEYLARMHLRLMDRPSYLIRTAVEHDAKESDDGQSDAG